MSEYDYDSERCYDCDGHFRHFEGCYFYRGEPFLDLEARVQLESILRETLG